jgi:hypothetical protein
LGNFQDDAKHLLHFILFLKNIFISHWVEKIMFIDITNDIIEIVTYWGLNSSSWLMFYEFESP